ncbi:CinA family protein [Sphingorhabdus soli]|uniref:CinA family protein n=1 Tax=Flavisphingopyxis soli TaxID=2601267 RepID=A0A5C6U7Y8_9SPHN|nr:CinA family protein [Sphingorhabdus soli]TXC69183.1 CinA family protein [Sphingorhabdus soli]
MTDPIFNLPRELIDTAARVIDENRVAGRTVALAESCTGGLVAACLTAVSGSSDVFTEGFVSYSNDAKVRMLGVSSEIIETFGAVSLAGAWAMALGALKNSDADIAVAVTGIAGPTGGSDQKPVGTVVFARAIRGQNPDNIYAERMHFDLDDRGAIRRQATLFALELLSPSKDAECAASPSP